MTQSKKTKSTQAIERPHSNQSLESDLELLKLSYCLKEYEHYAQLAHQNNWTHLQFFQELIKGEANAMQDRRLQRRIQQGKFGVIKTLDQFDWTWPKEINEMQVRHLFRLSFIPKNENIIFIGGVGLGKTHLASALGYQACLQGFNVLFVSAIEIVNNLASAHKQHRLKQELNRYIKPQLLIIDELGYLPIDKRDADLLFQVISERYEKGAIAVTTNKAFKDWPEIFSGDASLTSAALDRLLHYSQVITIEGSSFRMRGRIEE